MNEKQITKISIIIPVFNQEHYIEECLASCINQDVEKSEYEIILINDGSTDNSLSVIDNYLIDYNNIIVVNKNNSGVSAARNAGLDIASGCYVWFVDADDFIRENVLGMLLDRVNSLKSDVLECKACFFKSSITKEERAQQEQNESLIKFYGNNFLLWNNIYSRKLIASRHVRFYEDLKYDEDCLFNDCIRDKRTINVNRYDKLIYYYRLHESSAMGNLSSNTGKIEQIDAHIQFCKHVLEEVLNGTIDNKRGISLVRFYLQLMSKQMANLPIRIFAVQIRKMKKEGFFPYFGFNSKRFNLIIRPSYFYLNRIKQKCILFVRRNLDRLFHLRRTIKNIRKRIKQ